MHDDEHDRHNGDDDNDGHDGDGCADVDRRGDDDSKHDTVVIKSRWISDDDKDNDGHNVDGDRHDDNINGDDEHDMMANMIRW